MHTEGNNALDGDQPSDKGRSSGPIRRVSHSTNEGANIITSNVQGVMSPEFLQALRELTNLHDPKILTLFETKINDVCRTISFRGRVELKYKVLEEGFDFFGETKALTLESFTVTIRLLQLKYKSWGIPLGFSRSFVRVLMSITNSGRKFLNLMIPWTNLGFLREILMIQFP
ncbi:hypothetical protein Cgig2_016418 [Carnegiea gigantea]|uniref:Uncharacterized protein n=1 Tax=Carnegiea gigantea TaxID=171969 RepID=A0A9Q1Q591_9CARY|nr:hypothetical protein Cgig2_016412 [Carnegiea gigantea]KAJ8429135.1 hypothetical protein Cgig2_016418 [Carnegiea gigantea]